MFRWVDKGVNLGSLIERVQLFFEFNGFKTRIDKLKDGWLVSAVKSVEGNPKSVSVKVFGQPDDFTVGFSFKGYGRELAILGPLISLFGLGSVVRREVRWLEFFETLERNFWAYMENAVADIQVERKTIGE